MMDVGSSSKMGTTMSPAPIASRARLLSSTCITKLLFATTACHNMVTVDCHVQCHDAVSAQECKPHKLSILAVLQSWNRRVKPSDVPA